MRSFRSSHLCSLGSCDRVDLCWIVDVGILSPPSGRGQEKESCEAGSRWETRGVCKAMLPGLQIKSILSMLLKSTEDIVGREGDVFKWLVEYWRCMRIGGRSREICELDAIEYSIWHRKRLALSKSSSAAQCRQETRCSWQISKPDKFSLQQGSERYTAFTAGLCQGKTQIWRHEKYS